MAGKEKGTNVLLKVGDGATPEVFHTLAGQENTQFQGASQPIDTSSKDDGVWGSSLPGQIDGTVTAAGTAVWPDTDGLDRLRTVWLAAQSVNCELILNGAGKKWTGPFYVTAFSVDGQVKGATKYSLTLKNAGPLTYV